VRVAHAYFLVTVLKAREKSCNKKQKQESKREGCIIHDARIHLCLAPFILLKKQAETLSRLICCERKTLSRLKKQAKKDRLLPQN